MPSRERLDEFIAVVESGDHAGATERYYTEDASMQENASRPRAGRDPDRQGRMAGMTRRQDFPRAVFLRSVEARGLSGAGRETLR